MCIFYNQFFFLYSFFFFFLRFTIQLLPPCLCLSDNVFELLLRGFGTCWGALTVYSSELGGGSDVLAGLTEGLQEPRMLAEWEVAGCLSIPGFMGIFCSDLAVHLDSPGSV